jgi:hypothetical protein
MNRKILNDKEPYPPATVDACDPVKLPMASIKNANASEKSRKMNAMLRLSAAKLEIGDDLG